MLLVWVEGSNHTSFYLVGVKVSLFTTISMCYLRLETAPQYFMVESLHVQLC